MEGSFSNRSAPRDPLIGRVLHDRYKVEKRIGKGGMGVVYLAEHVLLRRKVALKTLSEGAFASEELIARFHREATAAAAVGNEHVVGVTDMGQLDDGSYFVVLEYLDGIELAHAVAEDGPFKVRRAARLIMQLCEALTAVHAAGIVHRDLKPENLFLVEKNGDRDFLKVLDFGVCKARGTERLGERPLTRTGASLGTPQFMAPEQIENSAAADARTDIYAAGALLFFVLTGRPPFEDSALPRLFMRICSEPPPPIRASRPELPEELEAVIARAMARNPDDRFPTSEALRTALEPFATGDTPFESAQTQITAQPLPPAPTTLELLPTPRFRSKRIAQAAVLALLVGAALAASALTSRPPESSPRTAAPHPDAPSAPTVKLDLTAATDPEPPKAAAPPVPITEPAKARKRQTPAALPPAATPPSDAQLTPEAPPATASTPVHPEPEPSARPAGAFRLSQRELKDVFP
jgi:eukaryotic-like serine/threonine-protein kinase